MPLPDHARAFEKSKRRFFDLPNLAQYNETLKALAEFASINKNLTSHVCRHTFAWMHISKVNSLPGLKEILGHAKVETTMRYVNLDNDSLFDTSMQLGEDFENLSKRR